MLRGARLIDGDLGTCAPEFAVIASSTTKGGVAGRGGGCVGITSEEVTDSFLRREHQPSNTPLSRPSTLTHHSLSLFQSISVKYYYPSSHSLSAKRRRLESESSDAVASRRRSAAEFSKRPQCDTEEKQKKCFVEVPFNIPLSLSDARAAEKSEEYL